MDYAIYNGVQVKTLETEAVLALIGPGDIFIPTDAIGSILMVEYGTDLVYVQFDQTSFSKMTLDGPIRLVDEGFMTLWFAAVRFSHECFRQTMNWIDPRTGNYNDLPIL